MSYLGYEGFLARRTIKDPEPRVEAGHSGYFSLPAPGFDPRLIHDGKLRRDVRAALLKLLYDFWDRRYTDPRSWSTVWTAGSALGHQWHGDRGGLGDLDVLIGVDHDRFLQLHEDFRGLPEELIDKRFNAELRILGAGTTTWRNQFETTWYVNPRATDIREIHPYAAYDLTHDRWTVKPIELPDDWNPHSFFPAQWWAQVNREADQARTYIERYQQVLARLTGMPAGSPQWVSAVRELDVAVDQAAALFLDIHDGRKKAFGGTGKGFLDYYNFRWQSMKYYGVEQALRVIHDMRDDAQKDFNSSTFGQKDLSANRAILNASLSQTRFRGFPDAGS